MALQTDAPLMRFDRAESADKLSAAITADPGAPSAADAPPLTTSRQVVAELCAPGWPLLQEPWVQDLEAEPQGGGRRRSADAPTSRPIPAEPAA